MRIFKPFIFLAICAALLVTGCGYYFPHVYDGPQKTVYMSNWHNRTSQLGLDSKIYQSLSRWFQKSDAITLTKDKASSDLILAGEIVNIDLPSVAWGGDARTTDAKVALVVRYILKDIKSDKVLWEVPQQLLTEDFSTEGGSTAMADHEQEALDQIISDLSEMIYLGTLEKLREENKAVK